MIQGCPPWSALGNHGSPSASAPSGGTTDTKSFLFDGVNDFCGDSNSAWSTFGLNHATHGPWTISIWFKTAVDSGYQELFVIHNSTASHRVRVFLGNAGAGYTIAFQTSQSSMTWDGLPGFGVTGAYTYFGQLSASGASNELCDGAWHQAVVTCEGVASTGKMRFYLDGALVTSGTQTASVCSPNAGVMVGKYTSSVNFLNGNIAQATFLTAELNAAGVTALYNGGASTDPTPLNPYAYYRFGDDPHDTTTAVNDNGLAGLDLTGAGFAPSAIVEDSPP